MAEQNTLQKALEINLDNCKYGSIVEIGAGQEVARNFFRAGGAAGTIAKTMSAYDMQVSDDIYGLEESGRYVTRSRLMKMLDKEFSSLTDLLTPIRSKNTTFFSYAATVTAKSYLQKNECHGWLGIRLQLYRGAAPSDVVIHVRMLDDDGSAQQEALGILGVNLIHATFEHFTNPKKIIESLLDNIGPCRIEVDMINFSGPYFEETENRLMNLHLVHKGLTHAVMFNDKGEIQIPGERLYKKNILILRGTFAPLTNVHIDMTGCGQRYFNETENISTDKTMVLAELTMASLTVGDKIDDADFLARVDMLNSQGYTVLVSNYLRYFRLRAYFRRYTQKQIGMILGISSLDAVFNEEYYEGMEGGILEAFAKLFPDNTRLYVYPYKNLEEDEIVTVDNFKAPQHLQHLYTHLLENGYLIGLACADTSLQSVDRSSISADIKKGHGDWESLVPGSVAEMIVEKKLLGFASS
ncbi:MAG: nicotinate-nucleotide adenylyltransferase [Methylophaga sp.]|nr:MAG: nicotinate-nucleotide adenylyltransferase [Methylophaga sp.]